MKTLRIATLSAACGLLAAACLAQDYPHVAVWPWTFDGGDKTSRTQVTETIRHILEHHGFAVLPQPEMERRFMDLNPAVAYRGAHPDPADLGRFASAVLADKLVGGHVHWDTRSIWVGTGPKTISTAKVEIFVYDGHTGSMEFQGKGEGRSDERENVLKDAGDVLVTPLITVVSGGPATPREQRAVQIAIARALRPWALRLPPPGK